VFFKFYIELDPTGPIGPVQELPEPPPNRVVVRLLNLAYQVGLARGASGFSLSRTCSPHPRLKSHPPSVGSKVTGLHGQGRGSINLSD